MENIQNKTTILKCESTSVSLSDDTNQLHMIGGFNTGSMSNHWIINLVDISPELKVLSFLFYIFLFQLIFFFFNGNS